MRIIQTRRFEQKVKKLSKSEKRELDVAIRLIIEQPSIGEQKKGDLRSIYVYKFRINKTLYLLAYRYTPDIMELIMLGLHENYYKDIKNYLRSR